MNRSIALVVVILFASLLQACSGGGSGSSAADTSPINVALSSSGSVTISKTTLQFGETATVSAVFKQSNGSPAAGISVNFSTSLGTLTPANGIATTDSNGVASVQLTAGSNSGQGQITASATVENNQVTNSGLFSINLPPLKLSNITLGLATLSFGGSTSVSVTVTDANGVTYTGQDVDVTFTSTQASLGKATVNSPVRTVNGVATTTYLASTATGTDTITASIAGSSVTASVTINPLVASSVSFVSASPANIGLKGMGGAGIQETSKVTFKVLDTAGQPKANQQVNFALNTNVGGLSLVSTSGSTASDGTVSTTVQAGTIATPVRVTATLNGIAPVIATQSDQLVVSTGVASQDSLSISIETFNPEAWTTDGVQDRVTARLSDHFHNPVPDGTAVSFTASAGSIQPSCTTIGGACSVTWTSQNPRPLQVAGASKNGRAVILAYAVGEEAFLDVNGNGVADAGEFTDTSEAFRDDNEDGTRNPGETFIDFNSDGTFNVPDGKYNGVLQGLAFVGSPKSKHVFSNSVIVMASSAALITNSCGNSINVLLGSSTPCSITVSDVNGNTMPAGTTVAFSYTSIVSGIQLTSDAFTFPNSIANIGTTLGIVLTDSGVAPTPVGRGVFKVSVKSPGGLETFRNFSVN